MGYWLAYTLILIVGLTGGIGVLIAIRRYWKNSSFLRQLIENITFNPFSHFFNLYGAPSSSLRNFLLKPIASTLLWLHKIGLNSTGLPIRWDIGILNGAKQTFKAKEKF